MVTKLKKLTETEKRILLWMLTDLSMVLILCGKLLRKWASEFEWGMWRNIEWGIGIGVTAVGVLGIAAALYLVWKFRENTGNPKMTAFAGSEPEKAGKTAKSSEGAAADKSETDEIEKSRQMQFEARAAAEAEKEQLFLKKSEKVPNELLVLVGGFAFFGWLQPLRHSYARYRIVAEWGTVIECVQTGLLFFGICGVFLLSAGILVCRYEKKQLREMSFFCRERKRYRDRTSLERQLAGQHGRAFQAMSFRRFSGGGIVQVVQQPGQAPKILILAETARQRPHNGLRGQSVLQQRYRRALVRQQLQGFVSFNHHQAPLML